MCARKKQALKTGLFKISRTNQYFISIGGVLAVTGIGLLVQDFVGYRVIAFLLLVSVSILAMLLDIVPVLLAAILIALLWDVLFIPPRFEFTVGTTEDRWLLLMYFAIALINAVLTYKLKEMEREMRAKEVKAKAIHFYSTIFNSLARGKAEYLKII